MQHTLTGRQAQEVTRRFGAAFCHALGGNIGHSARRWGLHGLELVESYSSGCVFFCTSDAFGDCVLKIGSSLAETAAECGALAEYGGGRFCRVYAADPENGVLLEERIRPGTALRAETVPETRAKVFCGLYRGLHRTPRLPVPYPTYLEWVQRITAHMNQTEGHAPLRRHMNRAARLCARLWQAHPGRFLLHGDLHHDNILLDAHAGCYRIIDPKGVVGPAIFDVSRFILNEWGAAGPVADAGSAGRAIALLSAALGLSPALLGQCLYIEAVMAECWRAESGEAPCMERVLLAEAAMQQGGA